MRIYLAIAAFVLLGAVAHDTRPAAAQVAYQWCMQPSGLWGPDCSYSTIEQCRATAAAVGFCYQNPAYTAAQGRPERMRR